jgi:hypothetical protein
MMNVRFWLIGSVAVNVGLLVMLAWTRREPGQESPQRHVSVASVEAAVPTVLSADQPPPKIVSLAGMRDALRSAGVAPDLIAQVVNGMLQRERYKARRAASWWKGTPYGGDLSRTDPMDMHADQQALRELMDPRFLASEAVKQQDLSYLPEDKRAKVAAILRDYFDVSWQTRVAGLRVSSDQARDELLRAEMQRDLREVLSSEEYLEHTLRDAQSEDWIRLRIDAARFDLTEQEFRDTARSLLVARQIADEKVRIEAVERIHEELRKKVGPDRIFVARAKNTSEYTQLREAQIRFGFPQTATDSVIETWKRTYAAAESMRANGPADRAAKQAAWRELAAKTRKEILDTLGTEAGEAYLTQSMGWLSEWASGEDTRMGGGLMGRR